MAVLHAHGPHLGAQQGAAASRRRDCRPARRPRRAASRGGLRCDASSSSVPQKPDPFAEQTVYRDGPFEKALQWWFKREMKAQLGDSVAGSQFDGFDGVVELSQEIMKGRSAEQQRLVVARILSGLLPEAAAARFRRWFPPSKWSAELNARITQLGFAWLVGEMEVEAIEVGVAGGGTEQWRSGVKIKKCRYLEASGCKAMCVNMCKRPTQDFFSQQLGVALTLDPDFEDLSCEMRFGVPSPPPEQDAAYGQPCFARVCSLGDVDPARPCPKMEAVPPRR